MGFRIGKSFGKTYVSIGKSGTYVARTFDGIRVSYFKSSRTPKPKAPPRVRELEAPTKWKHSPRTDEYYDPTDPTTPYGGYVSDNHALDDETAETKQNVLDVSLIFVLAICAAMSAMFWQPFCLLLVVRTIWVSCIWWKLNRGAFNMIGMWLTPILYLWLSWPIFVLGWGAILAIKIYLT